MLVYRITNLHNKKVYIGKTQTDLETRWKLHIKHAFDEVRQTRFCHALRKYGADAFSKEVLVDNISSNEELNEHEIYFIKHMDSVNPHVGYNMSMGGDGGFTDDMRQKSATKRKHQGISPSHVQALIEGRQRVGYKPKTEDEKTKISLKLKQYYQEHPEHHRHIRTINQQKVMRGENHPMWGKKHTEHARQKISDARQGKTYEEIYGEKKAEELRNKLKSQTGNKNPNYSCIDKQLLEALIQNPLSKRQELCTLLECSGPTLTKRFQNLLGIDNMQQFRHDKDKHELRNFFEEKLNELLYRS